MKTKINPVIQVNGGTSSPEGLYNRELYLCYDDTSANPELIAGQYESTLNPGELGTALHIRVAEAMFADKANAITVKKEISESEVITYVNLQSDSANLYDGKWTFENDGLHIGTGKDTGDSIIAKDGTLQRFTLNTATINSATYGTMVLTPACYGTTFPSSPTNGQLFFKLQ